jgi:VWFA-related protein
MHGASGASLFAAVPQGGRTVRVTVTTNKGEAVLDLTSADVEVKEDGKTREVLKVELLSDLLSVAVLVDDRGSDINEIRVALAAFVVRTQGRAEISLVSVVPTVLKVFDYTSSVPTMMSGIQRLVWRAGPAGGLVLGAVADAADELTRREVKRPAIVVVTFEGEEFRSHRPANTILAALERSGAAMHVVAVGTPTMRKMNRAVVESGNVQGDDWTVDQTNRNAVLGDGPRQSGGRRQELTAASGLTKALEAVADDLLNQYAVVYAAASEAKSPRKLSITAKRRGLTVRAPTKIAVQ